jgi:hypothetical protein
MGAEPGRPNELSPITRIDTARVRPVQSAAGRSFIEPGSPWQNPFVESFGSRVRDEVLSVEAFDSVLEAQTVITDWRKRCSLLARKVSSKRGNFREPPLGEVRRTPLGRSSQNSDSRHTREAFSTVAHLCRTSGTHRSDGQRQSIRLVGHLPRALQTFVARRCKGHEAFG